MTWEKRASGDVRRKIEPDGDLARALSGLAGKRDCYFTVNQFYGWPKVSLLRGLRACYVDLDDCPSMEAALYAVDDAHLPRPAYAVESGNGVHLYWLLEPVPRQALPAWQAVQGELVDRLSSVGADRVARDCTRYLRLVGTINSEAHREVRGFTIQPGRWTLHQLADEVLGYRTPGLARTKSRSTTGVSAAVRGAVAPYQLWYSRYQDLCMIAERCDIDGSGVPSGHRDTLLFLLATALSWFADPATLYNEISRIAGRLLPTLSDLEVSTYTKPVVDRALLAAEGKTMMFGGVARDPRYHFKTETIREWLGDLIRPEIEKDLRVLLPRAALDERERLRQKNRVRKGRYKQSRADYLKEHSQERAKPWEAMGISRATYFRRKQAGEV